MTQPDIPKTNGGQVPSHAGDASNHNASNDYLRLKRVNKDVMHNMISAQNGNINVIAKAPSTGSGGRLNHNDSIEKIAGYQPK